MDNVTKEPHASLAITIKDGSETDEDCGGNDYYFLTGNISDQALAVHATLDALAAVLTHFHLLCAMSVFKMKTVVPRVSALIIRLDKTWQIHRPRVVVHVVQTTRCAALQVIADPPCARTANV